MQDARQILRDQSAKSVLPRSVSRSFFIFWLIVAVLVMSASLDCKQKSNLTQTTPDVSVLPQNLIVGAAQLEAYLPLLTGKKVGLVVNHTSLVGTTHLLDTLINLGVQVKIIFAPEHGFRGTADAGETIKNSMDQKTGIPVISLYGKKKAPEKNDLNHVDLLLFDIQDVGARFYTYLSTLHAVMEACAKHKRELIVLDRPNPNAHVVDGPILKPKLKSFVGLVPIPIAHGCTLGELARMIHGEKWIALADQLKFKVIPIKHYTHDTEYILPVPPSPNLRTQKAIYLYPTLCLFEGTEMSVGRGTETPFEVIGSPLSKKDNAFAFIPTSLPGAKTPPHLGIMCYGVSFADLSLNDTRQQFDKIRWDILTEAYAKYTKKQTFFLANQFFDKLCGDAQVRNAIMNGVSSDKIPLIYQEELKAYQLLRTQYLLYD
jgi:uncharacterized protein YbbC (DUF1343 family)